MLNQEGQGQRENGERRDYRHTCGRLLFRGYLPKTARVEIRCAKCGALVVLTNSINGKG